MEIKTHKSITALKPSAKECYHNVVNIPRLFLKQNKGQDGGLSWVFRYSKPIIESPCKLTLGKAGKFKNGVLNLAGVMTLAEASALANEYNSMLANNIDPKESIEKLSLDLIQSKLHTFEYFSNKHFDTLKGMQAESTVKRKRGRYDLLIGHIGKYPIDMIKPSVLQNALIEIQENSKSDDDEYTDKAHRIAIIASEIFKYAESITDEIHNPTEIAKRNLKPYFYGNRKGITEPLMFGQMIRDIETLEGNLNVVNSLRLLSMLFVRNGDLRRMKWSDIDFENKVWNLQPLKSESTSKIRMVKNLMIPLPSQAINILNQQKEFNSEYEYVFHNFASTKEQFIHTNAANNALESLGYKNLHTTHGFRASAKSFLKGLFKYPNEFIEMALGHVVKDANGTAYDRWQYLDERREMLQFYADWLDALKEDKDTSSFVPYDKRHLISNPKELLISSFKSMSTTEKAEILALLQK